MHWDRFFSNPLTKEMEIRRMKTNNIFGVKYGAFLALLTFVMISANTYASNVTKGQKSYQRYCSTCHGRSGDSTMSSAPNFSRGEGLMKSDKNLVAQIEKGKKACPSFRGVIKEHDLYDLAAYLRTLQ